MLLRISLFYHVQPSFQVTQGLVVSALSLPYVGQLPQAFDQHGSFVACIRIQIQLPKLLDHLRQQ